MKIKEVILNGLANRYFTETNTTYTYHVGCRMVYAKDDKLSATHFYKIELPSYILPEQKNRFFKAHIMKLHNEI